LARSKGEGQQSKGEVTRERGDIRNNETQDKETVRRKKNTKKDFTPQKGNPGKEWNATERERDNTLQPPEGDCSKGVEMCRRGPQYKNRNATPANV